MNLLREASLLSILMLSACAAGSPRTLELEGSRWRLVGADGGPLAARGADSRITLEFAAERVSGNGGCNQYSGSYTLTDGALVVGPVVSTKRDCAEAGANESERAWFGILASPLTASMQDEVLRLRTADGVELSFAAATKSD